MPNLSSISPPPAIIEADRPPTPAGLLSRTERDRLIERGFLGLYRWYTQRSQETRNWNPDLSFDWKGIRHDLSPETGQVLEGFFAVEQYAPDYTSKFLHLIRRSHGRSHFQMRWGSEEEKHADSWENAVLFSRLRTPQQIADYKHALRSKEWDLPWDDALRVLVYTVFQERATQLNYLNMAKIATGMQPAPAVAEAAGVAQAERRGLPYSTIALLNDADPVLAKVSTTIAVDEAAHYNFFLEGVRLFLYYYPLETLEAIRDVLANFSMPADQIIPNWDDFFEVVYKTGIYGPRQYSRDVVAVVFKNLGIEGRKALEDGIKRTRLVPTEDGQMRGTAIWETFDPATIEYDVRRLHEKIQGHERRYGMDEVDPTAFVPNPVWPNKT